MGASDFSRSRKSGDSRDALRSCTTAAGSVGFELIYY